MSGWSWVYSSALKRLERLQSEGERKGKTAHDVDPVHPRGQQGGSGTPGRDLQDSEDIGKAFASQTAKSRLNGLEKGKPTRH